jgi:hypothetical protein
LASTGQSDGRSQSRSYRATSAVSAKARKGSFTTKRDGAKSLTRRQLALPRARALPKQKCQGMRGLCLADPRITEFNALRARQGHAQTPAAPPVSYIISSREFSSLTSHSLVLPLFKSSTSQFAYRYIIRHIHRPLHSLLPLSAPLSLSRSLASGLPTSRSGTSQNPLPAPLWREPLQGRGS